MVRVPVACLLVLFLSVAANAADRSGWKVVERGIVAAGGFEVLGRHKMTQSSEKGTYHGQGTPIPFSSRTTIGHPWKYRMEMEGMLIVFDGTKGWTRFNGVTTPMTPQEIDRQIDEEHASLVGTLLPLKDEAYGLQNLGELKSGNRSWTMVKVTHKEYEDVSLDFDNATGLLGRIRSRVWSEELMADVDQEVNLLDYKDRSGAKVPCRTVLKRNGKLFVETTVEDFRTFNSLDESLFRAP